MEGEQETLVPRVEAVRDAYLDRLAAQQDGLQALCRSAGWSWAIHRTDRSPQTALLTLFAALSQDPVDLPTATRSAETAHEAPMLTLGPLVFTTPWILLALGVLPLIYWLLRVTPPAPRLQKFPPSACSTIWWRRRKRPTARPGGCC